MPPGRKVSRDLRVEGQEEDMFSVLCPGCSRAAAETLTQKAEQVSHVVVGTVGFFCLWYVPYAALTMSMVNSHPHGLDLRLVTIPAFFSKSVCVYDAIIYCFMNKQVKLLFTFL